MNQFAKKAAAVGFLALLILWVGGVLRGSTLPYPEPPAWSPMGVEEVSYRQQAQSNNLRQLGLTEVPLTLMLDRADVDRIHVHEKVAYLAAGTTAFEGDEARIRGALTAHEATVFNE